MSDARSPIGGREERQQALLQAAQAAVQDAHEKAAARRPPAASKAPRIILAVLCLAIFGVGTYILAVKPAWFFTPPAATETVQIQEASMRLMMVREASRVRSYRAKHGKMPTSLAEAGSQVTNLTYTAQGDSAFRLMTTWGEHVISLSSSDSVSTFIGNSLKVIASRGRP